MKILIAEDNLAIHEILTEILKSTEHDVVHTYTLENAKKTVEEYDPDLVILDDVINGENGMDIINDYDEESKLSAIVLTMDLSFTTDNQLVVGVLQKPFKAKDLLHCIKKKDSIRKKNAKGMKITDRNVKRPVVKFGTQYVVFERKPSYVYKLASVFSNTCQIIVFTKYSKSKISRKIRGKPEVYILSNKIRAKSNVKQDIVDVGKLGTLLTIAKEFMSDKLQPVVVFDDLKKIIDENGTNATMTLIHQLITNGVQTVIVSVDKEYFTDEEIKIILGEMKEYVIE